ncbi:MAG: hypothetical protein R6V55_03855 [Desulfovermiculus sp.]
MRPMPDVDIHDIEANWKHGTDIRFGLHRIQELPDICWELAMIAIYPPCIGGPRRG